MSGRTTIGPNNGSTFQSELDGNNDWTSPGNAASNNSSYASAVALSFDPTYYLKATGFGFSVPTEAQINGIIAEIDRFADPVIPGLPGITTDNHVYLVMGGIVQNGSTNQATGSAWPNTDTDTYVSYGSPTDTWGNTLLPSDVNATDFGFAMSAKQDDGTNVDTQKVDHMRATVYYSPFCPFVIGPVNGGSFSSYDGYGGNPWANPSNAQTNNSVYTSHLPLSSFARTERLHVKNFGFNIPATAVIKGVVVEINRYRGGQGNTYDDVISLLNDAESEFGDNKALTGVAWPTSDDDTYKVYGSPTDGWGASLTPDIVNNSSFGVSVGAWNDSTDDENVYLDHVRLTLYYTAPGECPVAHGQVQIPTTDSQTASLAIQPVI